ncbi:ABC transporter permease [Plantactinospora sp. GCM10030261]|uniref:ABC transporter permease n=1 Tax=Plantactinospora sp. GCM10030261 TaxID=3273420 RepID=UPI00360C873B
MTAAGRFASTVRLARRSPGGRASPVLALLRRDLVEQPILRVSLLFDFAFATVNLAIFLLISRLIPESGGPTHSAGYFDFVAVGLAFTIVIQAATAQLTSRIAREQRGGTLEVLAAQPVRGSTLAVGLAAYPFLFAVFRAAVYFAVLGPLLGLGVDRADWAGVAVLLLLGGAAMAGVGIVLMAFAIVVGHGDLAGRVVVLALAFLSGTYFPIETLDPRLETVTAGLPSRVALDGLRAAVAGDSWIEAALILLASTAVLVPAAAWIFGRAVRLAAKRGVLTRD